MPASTVAVWTLAVAIFTHEPEGGSFFVFSLKSMVVICRFEFLSIGPRLFVSFQTSDSAHPILSLS